MTCQNKKRKTKYQVLSWERSCGPLLIIKNKTCLFWKFSANTFYILTYNIHTHYIPPCINDDAEFSTPTYTLIFTRDCVKVNVSYKIEKKEKHFYFIQILYKTDATCYIWMNEISQEMYIPTAVRGYSSKCILYFTENKINTWCFVKGRRKFGYEYGIHFWNI